jgi:hypothetical protein
MDEMNAVLETTISTETESAESNEVNETFEGAPQGTEETQNTAEDGEQSAIALEGQAEETVEPFLEIKYNHESKGLTREETVTLAQKGMHYEGTYKALERVATLKGQSVKDFLNGIEEAQDEAYRQGLIDKFGEDEDTISKMMELYQINKQKTLDDADLKRQEESAQAEQSINERLASEFVEMKNGDFPELTDFASLPNEVKRAATEGMSLSHAYLTFMHRENKKIAAQKASEEAAAKKSTGSMADGTVENKTEAEQRYLSALWGK